MGTKYVITLDEDGKIATCNAAGIRIMGLTADDIVGQLAEEFFTGANQWIIVGGLNVKSGQYAVAKIAGRLVYGIHH